MLVQFFISGLCYRDAFQENSQNFNPWQNLDNIKSIEEGAKHDAVAIANCVSRSTVTKIVLNKRNRLGAVMVRWTDDHAYVNSKERSPHPLRGIESALH